MGEKIACLMETYGTDLLLVQDQGQKTIRGFFQAVNSKSWQSIESEATLLGELTRGQYLYLGPAGTGAQEGDTLVLGTRSYLLRRVEDYYFENVPVYQWGLCVEKGVNDTWGTPS